MPSKIYVGNMSYSTTEEELRGLFAQYGEVVSVNVVYDRATDRPRGFAFVEMGTAESAESAWFGSSAAKRLPSKFCSHC